MTRTKTLPARVKVGDEQTPVGAFTAVVAAYNTDSSGDRIVPGAFAKTLAAWKSSGSPIPIVWAHRHDDPFAHVGHVTTAAETDDGLVVDGQLDIEDNPTAKQVYKLIKGGRVKNYSFAYDVTDASPADPKSDDGARTLLKELELFEVGPCLVGDNRSTRTLAVKAESVSNTPWSQFSASDYTDEQYARACLLDRGPDAGTAKQRYSLPVREPSGTLNRGGCHAAASVLGGGRGGVSAPADAKQKAARKLVALYRGPLGEDPPDALLSAAGEKDHAAQTKAQVPGSYEAVQEAISDALTSATTSQDAWAYPIATFADHVVYQMTGTDGGTYSAPYTLADDGSVELGEATAVEITDTVVPQTAGAAALQSKEGRVLSTANLTALQQAVQSIQDGLDRIEAVTGVADSDDPEGNGSTQTGEPAKSDEDLTVNTPRRVDEPDGKSDDAHAHVPADVSTPLFDLAQVELSHLI